MERITSYWVTQVIGAVARLSLADRLAQGPRSSEVIAQEMGASPDGVYRLLRGGVSVGLFEEPSPRTFTLTPMGQLLRSGVPGSMRDMAIAQSGRSQWLPWGQLHEAVRTGGSVAKSVLGTDVWEHFARHPEESEYFARAMGDLTAVVARELPSVHDFSCYPRIADIGGSQGVLLEALLRAHPTSRGILFELPNVIDGARSRLEAVGLADRVELVGGSFFDPVLPPAEAYLLKHIVHVWDDATCTKLLSNIHRAAPEGARLFVLEMVIPEDGKPSTMALMDLNMLVVVDGRERTAREFEALLASSSWALERITPMHMGVSLIEAVRRS